MWARSLLVLGALSGACTSSQSSPAMPDTTEHPPLGGQAAQNAALRVAVTLEPSTVRAGESMLVTVTVSNAGTEARTLESTSGCFTDYEVLDAGGTVIATSGQSCTAQMARRELAPGASFSEQQRWVRDLAGMPRLPVGALQVRGLLLAGPDTLRSSPVSLTIAP